MAIPRPHAPSPPVWRPPEDLCRELLRSSRTQKCAETGPTDSYSTCVQPNCVPLPWSLAILEKLAVLERWCLPSFYCQALLRSNQNAANLAGKAYRFVGYC